MENIFDIPVSYYKSIKDNEGVAVSLHTLLTKHRPEHLSYLEKVRAATTAEEKNSLKKQLPLFTPSAQLANRIATVPLSEKLISYTGFIQFDIDSKENPGMNACQLRDAIAGIPFVAYASLSASGRGVWGLVRIECPEQLDRHYQQFKEVLERAGIKLDTTKGRNATDLRYISFDPKARINYAAVPLPLPPPPKTKPKPVFRPNVVRTFTGQGYGHHGDSIADVELLVNEAVARGMNLLDDYGTWFAVGSAFARELGESGRAMFHDLSQFDSKYDYRETEKNYSAWIKYPNNKGQLGTFFNACKQRGLLAKELRNPQPYKPAPRTKSPEKRPYTETFINEAGRKVTNEINEHGYPADWDKPAIFCKQQDLTKA